MSVADVRILVIEQDPDLARLFTSILQLEGYRVAVQRTLAGADQALADAMPDLIVIDWPANSAAGYVWAEGIRSTPPYAHIPILIICDGTPERAARELLIELGIATIEKPFDLWVFSRTVAGELPERERAVGA